MIIKALKDYRDLKGDPGSAESVAHLRGLLGSVGNSYLRGLLLVIAFVGLWVPSAINEIVLPRYYPRYVLDVNPIVLILVGGALSVCMVWLVERSYWSKRRHTMRMRPPGYILLALYDAMSQHADRQKHHSSDRQEAVKVVAENVDWLLGFGSPRLQLEMPCYIFRLGLMLTDMPRHTDWPEIEALHEKIIELDLCRNAPASRWYKYVWRRQRNDTEFVRWVLARWGA